MTAENGEQNRANNIQIPHFEFVCMLCMFLTVNEVYVQKNGTSADERICSRTHLWYRPTMRHVSGGEKRQRWSTSPSRRHRRIRRFIGANSENRSMYPELGLWIPTQIVPPDSDKDLPGKSGVIDLDLG